MVKFIDLEDVEQDVVNIGCRRKKGPREKKEKEEKKQEQMEQDEFVLREES
jgi:hypothetical protein